MKLISIKEVSFDPSNVRKHDIRSFQRFGINNHSLRKN